MVARTLLRFSQIFPACVLWAALAIRPEPALAVPLDADACNKLQTERQSLNVLGVDKYIVKGPDWAKANLKAADLNLVKRYLDVYEQLKFRCEKVIPVIEPPEDDDGEESEATAAGGGRQPPVPNRTPPATVENVENASVGAGQVSTPKSDPLQPINPLSTPKSAPLKPTNSTPSPAAASVGPVRVVPAQ